MERLEKVDPKTCPHRMVEDEHLTVRELRHRLSETKFTHFLDGIQRAQTLYYDGLSPVVYGFTAAAIRERVERRMRGDASWLDTLEAIYVPPEVYAAMDVSNLPINLAPTRQPADGIPRQAGMLQAASERVANRREEQETRLAARWLEEHKDEPESWLVIDGSIADVYARVEGVLPDPQMVGIAKSHNTVYFQDREELELIHNLPVGSRTSVFAPIRKNRPEVYSWYLRLRAEPGTSPTFGLVRLEVAPFASMLERADDISAWVMAERTPLSLPDARFDRLIYPIHEIELALNALAPSRAFIQSCLGA